MFQPEQCLVQHSRQGQGSSLQARHELVLLGKAVVLWVQLESSGVTALWKVCGFEKKSQQFRSSKNTFFLCYKEMVYNSFLRLKRFVSLMWDWRDFTSTSPFALSLEIKCFALSSKIPLPKSHYESHEIMTNKGPTFFLYKPHRTTIFVICNKCCSLLSSFPFGFVTNSLHFLKLSYSCCHQFLLFHPCFL